MADTSADRTDVKNLRSLVDAITDEDWVSAATKAELGQLNFAPILPTLRSMADLAKAFGLTDLGRLSTNRIRETTNSFNQISAELDRLKAFNLNVTSPQDTRDRIAQAIINHYDSLFNLLSGPIGLWAAMQIDIPAIKDSLEASISGRLEGATKQYDEALHTIQNASREATETLDAIKKAAGQVGVAENAKIFEGQAAEHLNSSIRWAKFTAVMAVVTVAWGAVALWLIPILPGADISRIVQEAIAKLIVFSGLSYGLVWCARNYSANRHNYILNKHRQNSLTTFETFVKAAGDDPDIKNAVLLQATTAIFAPQTTGYSTKEPDMDQPTKLLEIVRSAKSST